MTHIDFELDGGGGIPAPRFAQLAALAEQAGFGAIWKGETSNHNPALLLAAAAAETSTALLGTSVLHLFARTPVAAGMLAATLDELTAGRFLLGLGVANPTLAGWHGGTFRRPLAMARDYIAIVRSVLAAARVEHGGAYASTGFRRTGPVSTPPIILAGLGPQMSALAGEIADGVALNMATADAVAQTVAAARAAAARAGKDPAALHVTAKLRVAFTTDEAKGRDALRPSVAIYTRAAGYRELLGRSGIDLDALDAGWEASGFRGAIASVTDAALDRLPTVCTTDLGRVRAAANALGEAGATRVIVEIVPVDGAEVGETERFLTAWKDAPRAT